ncbi:BRCT domain-containing protein [Marinomonas sp.]|uniref:BRCT domain-containing protein n=1 Tax=Marinomonas sp. TaxID=1904862 RepID=UPI003F9D5FBA
MDRITPNYALASNKKKAIYSLKGILQGITADETLNDMEALYLNNWLLDAKPLRNDPDAFDLLDAIKSALDDNHFSKDELTDLGSLIADIVEFKPYEDVTTADYVNEFLGLLSGIVSDDVINDKELGYILGWISVHEDVLDNAIVKEVSQKILRHTRTPYPTTKEKSDLLAFIKKNTGTQFIETGSTTTHPLEHIADKVDRMDHEYARICFTGIFNTGSRKEVESIATDLGAITRKDPSKSIDYVIIGSQVSPDWKHTSFGRKIQKAIELRESGHPLIILTEKQWSEFI